MLTTLHLTNFQRHKDESLSFGPNINVIVGPTNKGKTAIIRALQVLTQNSPRGSIAFINHDAPLFAIMGTFDGVEVLRRRSKDGKLNEYRLDGKDFHALGQGTVPEEIEQFLNLHSCSFQLQHDQPFWLFDSPSSVAKSLNEIINLDIIDRVVDESAKQLRRVKSEKHIVEDRLAEVRERKADLEWIVQCDADYKLVEEWREYCEYLDARTTQIEAIHRNISQARLFQRTKKKAIVQGKKVIALGEEVLTLNKQIQRLSEIRNKLLNLKKKKQRIPNIKSLQAIREKGDQITRACESAELIFLRWKDLLERKARIQQELQETKTRLANLPQRCPVCHQLLLSHSPTSTSATPNPGAAKGIKKAGSKKCPTT